jgi:integrase/recombinase XerD
MSAIRQAVGEYLALRRALGFKLHLEGCWLEQFASFLEGRRASHITAELALQWATMARAQPVHLTHRLSVLRGFAAFRAASDPRTEVPPLGLLPHRFHRKPPYIYTDQEIAQLLRAAARLPSRTGLRPRTHATLLGLLVVTGMRIGEVVALDRDDVDIDRAVLTVRRTKFGKSRLVPVHASTGRALQVYAGWRDRVHPKPRTASFLVGERGNRLVVNTVEQIFVQLSHQVGLRGPTDRTGPRLHDIRHRFAVNTMLQWYRSGVDVERHLPQLSTYLGHAHVTDTYWYLSAVPELMHLIVARLERPKAGSS